MLAVQVIDTGVGLTPEEIPELCNKFGKLFRTAEMNHEGIGLGLTISKALIEALGGTLKIASDGKDLGSVFAFTMKMDNISEEPSSVQTISRQTGTITAIVEERKSKNKKRKKNAPRKTDSLKEYQKSTSQTQ